MAGTQVKSTQPISLNDINNAFFTSGSRRSLGEGELEYLIRSGTAGQTVTLDDARGKPTTAGGSQSYTTPGSYSFLTPVYRIMNIQVLGGGGGGGGSGYTYQTSFAFTITAAAFVTAFVQASSTFTAQTVFSVSGIWWVYPWQYWFATTFYTAFGSSSFTAFFTYNYAQQYFYQQTNTAYGTAYVAGGTGSAGSLSKVTQGTNDILVSAPGTGGPGQYSGAANASDGSAYSSVGTAYSTTGGGASGGTSDYNVSANGGASSNLQDNMTHGVSGTYLLWNNLGGSITVNVGSGGAGGSKIRPPGSTVSGAAGAGTNGSVNITWS